MCERSRESAWSNLPVRRKNHNRNCAMLTVPGHANAVQITPEIKFWTLTCSTCTNRKPAVTFGAKGTSTSIKMPYLSIVCLLCGAGVLLMRPRHTASPPTNNLSDWLKTSLSSIFPWWIEAAIQVWGSAPCWSCGIQSCLCQNMYEVEMELKLVFCGTQNSCPLFARMRLVDAVFVGDRKLVSGTLSAWRWTDSVDEMMATGWLCICLWRACWVCLFGCTVSCGWLLLRMLKGTVLKIFFQAECRQKVKIEFIHENARAMQSQLWEHSYVQFIAVVRAVGLGPTWTG